MGCQEPPASSSLLLSPLLAVALINRGRALQPPTPPVTCPRSGQGDSGAPDGKMTAAAATTQARVKEHPALSGFSF